MQDRVSTFREKPPPDYPIMLTESPLQIPFQDWHRMRGDRRLRRPLRHQLQAWGRRVRHGIRATNGLHPPAGFLLRVLHRKGIPVPAEAAGLLGFTLTAYESLELAARHMAARGKQLEGSTVFVPGALSATGAVAVQLLKNVYGVKKLVATVSTPKVALVEQHLPGLVDQVVDYKTTPTLTSAVPAGSVDFAYNTQQSSLESLIPLVNKDTGVVISIASVFPSRLLRLALGPALPFWAAWLADLLQLYYRWLIRGTSIELDFVSGNAGDREIVEKTAEVIALRKVKCVMRVVDLEDIDSLRKACGEVYSGKGGLGKLVVKIV